MALKWSIEFDDVVRVARIKTELASLGEPNLPGAEQVQPRIDEERRNNETVNQAIRHKLAMLRVYRESLE